MAISESETFTAVQQCKSKLARRVGRDVGLIQCLVVSAKAARQEMLVEAATSGGWQTIVCSDAPSALRCLSRVFVQLALVDLEGPGGGDLRIVVEKLAASPGVLLIVCGNEDDVQEEIWARQLGAWLYLPGADAAGMSMLCDEARQLTEQLAEVPQSKIRNGFEFESPQRHAR